MMKFHTVIASTAAVLLGVPAVVAGQDELATLRAALASTENSLGVLQQVAAELTGGAAPKKEALLRATEPPILDAPARDRRLAELRGQVSSLTTQVDEAEALAAPEAFIRAAEERVVYGFDDDVRRALRTLGLSDAAPKSRQAPAEPRTANTPPTPPPTQPAARYNADPLGQARALFHAKKYQRVVDLLASSSEDPEALYWHGRALERLGRLDEAFASLEAAKAKSKDELLTRLIETDLEFVVWRKSSFPVRDGGSR